MVKNIDEYALKSLEKGLYFVAFKVLLRDNTSLLLTHDIFGEWDIPGGRMKPYEFGGKVEDVIARKIHEELGAGVRYRIGQPKAFFQVERVDKGRDEVSRIFAVGFEAEYLGGDIQLGEHHDKYEWVDTQNFEPSDYLKGGWLDGLVTYIATLR